MKIHLGGDSRLSFSRSSFWPGERVGLPNLARLGAVDPDLQTGQSAPQGVQIQPVLPAEAPVVTTPRLSGVLTTR